MKIKLKYLILTCFVASSVGCSEKLETYNSQDNRLGFYYEVREDSLLNYTFVYDKETVTEHTVDVAMVTLGFVTDYDRTIKIVQVPAGEGLKDAVAGTHYIPFDDPAVAQKYVVKAGEAKIKIPIVFKRDESLLTDKYYLRLKVTENEYFIPSYEKNIERTIEITDMISKPKNWNGQVEVYFAGDYGPVKYRFMIDVADFEINDKWFDKHFGNPNSIDMGYTEHLATYFAGKLRERNAELAKAGQPPLTEEPIKPGAPGVKVQFKLNGTIIE